MADDLSKQPLIVHLMISGCVQGVSYRVWLKAEADGRGISGWTRNRANGDVEAVLAGPPDAVRSLSEICRSGPPMARVDQVLIVTLSPQPWRPLAHPALSSFCRHFKQSRNRDRVAPILCGNGSLACSALFRP